MAAGGFYFYPAASAILVIPSFIEISDPLHLNFGHVREVELDSSIVVTNRNMIKYEKLRINY